MEIWEEASCVLCGRRSKLISSFLGVCRDCIIKDFGGALPFIQAAHRTARAYFRLPFPVSGGEPGCKVCVHRCGKREKSFCGLVEQGKRWAGSALRGLCEWYYDALPTNCVASFVCEGKNYRGYQNLAVFYGGCNFDCLFCQNWHHHSLVEKETPLHKVEELLQAVHPKVACVCFFGGDPIPQIAHALAAAVRLREGVRICWETNGAVEPKILERMFLLSAESGGILKFDLKAFDERIHFALTGVSNWLVLQNFAWAAQEAKKYPRVTVVASTLLVPGYVTEDEVEKIAEFIAKVNPDIPYALLGFAPNFFMENLPPTSSRHAEEAFKRCKQQGLSCVQVGNRFLLSRAY
ncbi:MAG: radical SAM protein [Candidatus Caldatribacteriaceae bacterium]